MVFDGVDLCNGVNNMNNIVVYDLFDFRKRKLDTKNLDDDITCGFIYFSYEALKILSQHYSIIGYCMLSSFRRFPIDILSDKICLFEGVFNSLDESVKDEVSKYNIFDVTKGYLSTFMNDWQFKCDFNCFDNHGKLIKLSSKIIGTKKYLNKALTDKTCIYYPTCYVDFCNVVSSLINLFELNYLELDWETNIKEIISSCIKKLYIRLTMDQMYEFIDSLCVYLLNTYFGEVV